VESRSSTTLTKFLNGTGWYVNTAHARNRAPGERAVATLKTWKVLTRLRRCPSRATAITKAILVLQTIHDQP